MIFSRESIRQSGGIRVQRTGRRRGFTLLEVLVALALSFLLISAVYAGLRMYWRYSTSGHEEVERALLARSLLRKIEMDVRTVMYRAAPAATTTDTSASGSGSSGSSSTGGGTSGSSSSGSSGSSGTGSSGSGGSGSSGSSGSGSSSSSSSSSSDTTAVTDLYNTSNTGLFGTTTTLLMHCSKPGHEQLATSLAMLGNMQARSSDLATVAYFVSGTTTGNLQHAVTTPGLARLEGDRLALALADQQSNIAVLAARTQILAPEVAAIRFLFFDGFRWLPDWDSNTLGGLPKAIDVTMQLRPTSPTSTLPNVYHLLIAIPLAKPVDTSLVTTQTTTTSK
jgi:prepilin-type N-terminal cleavage/methylation domain-containing protein